MLRAAIFDVDGTLVNSNDLHAEAWAEIFRRFGVDLPHAVIRNQIGKGGDNLLPALLPPKLLEAHGAEMEEQRGELFKRAYLPRVRPFPGVRELFRSLQDQGVRTVLASSASGLEVEQYQDLLGIGDLLDGTTSKDDVAHSKPCPDIFEAALAKLPDIAPGEAVAVGDSPYDMEAAAKLGIAGIGLLCGGFDPGLLRWAGAAALFEGPWALPDRAAAWLRQPAEALS